MEEENITKKCAVCGEKKALEAFGKQKRGKFGRTSRCYACRRDENKVYRQANKDKITASSKAYRAANPEKIKARGKAYRQANKEKIKASSKAYFQNNKEERNAYSVAWQRNRYATDEHFRMQQSIRNAMRRWKNGSTRDMIGISFDEFATMYGTGEGMHLDHRVPLSWFDVDNADHNRVCQHHSNLQWLSPEDNLSKRHLYADVAGTKILQKDFDLEAYVQDKLKEI